VFAAARRFGAELAWYVPLGLKAWFTWRGITNVTEMDWWQEVQHPGSKVQLVHYRNVHRG
jgi:N-acyl-phosphatidylethanolamine-hydrolysing phospholipase D